MGAAAVTPVGRAIEGYASEASALPGDTLQFHVSTSPAAPYRIELYRLGWYGGAGRAADRLHPELHRVPAWPAAADAGA